MVERFDAHGDEVCDPNGPLVSWESYQRLLAEVERLRAIVDMMVQSFEDWEEPVHDGTREWCSRFGSYLRGNVIALATFTEKEWQEIKAIKAAEAAGGKGCCL